MSKLRLEIVKYHMIIMRNIISVTIVDVEFKKSDYIVDSRILQNFYNFIKRNKSLITFITYKDRSIDDYVVCMYLKDNKLHCEFDQAYYKLYFDTTAIGGISTFSSSNNYYLNDEKLELFEWKQRLRKIKLDRIKKLI